MFNSRTLKSSIGQIFFLLILNLIIKLESLLFLSASVIIVCGGTPKGYKFFFQFFLKVIIETVTVRKSRSSTRICRSDCE